MALAGLWETWMGPNGEEMETAAIVTTQANRTLQFLHDRMPVIVAPDAFGSWLDAATVDVPMAATLIVPAHDDLLALHPVSPAVNRTANDGPALIEPVAIGSAAAAAPDKPKRNAKARKDDRQGSLF
jgi:putative SOS response-associated peptidase YedK